MGSGGSGETLTVFSRSLFTTHPVANKGIRKDDGRKEEKK